MKDIKVLPSRVTGKGVILHVQRNGGLWDVFYVPPMLAWKLFLALEDIISGIPEEGR